MKIRITKDNIPYIIHCMHNVVNPVIFQYDLPTYAMKKDITNTIINFPVRRMKLFLVPGYIL